VAPRVVERSIDWGDRVSARGDRMLRGRGVRRIWLVGASLVAVVLLAFGTFQVAERLAHEERTEVAEFPASRIDGLVVDNGAGSVTVVGVDDAEAVTVTARISDGLRDTGHSATERDGRLVVEGSCPHIGDSWCEVDYTIEVPGELPIEVESRDSITVSDVDSGVVAHSDQGTVDLSRVGGDVDASANQDRLEGTDLTAGRVTAEANQGRIELTFAESPRTLDVSADEGRIEIVLPDEDDVVYAVSTDADQGTVSDDAIRTDPDSTRTIRAEADQGDITISYAAT
jgi:hypothetical protein